MADYNQNNNTIIFEDNNIIVEKYITKNKIRYYIIDKSNPNNIKHLFIKN